MTAEPLRCHFLYPCNVFASSVPSRIKTLLGSCIAVCLYDPVLTIGGMNHFMLPLWSGRELESPKYGNVAIDMLLEKMIGHGCQKRNMIAKVFGGATHFKFQHDKQSIGERNSHIAQHILEKYCIPVTACSTGGSKGREIVLNTCTGQVLMRYIVQEYN